MIQKPNHVGPVFPNLEFQLDIQLHVGAYKPEWPGFQQHKTSQITQEWPMFVPTKAGLYALPWG